MTTLPHASAQYDQRNEQETRTQLERALSDLGRPLPKYSVPQLEEPVRALTESSDLTELREALITLINDLQNRRVT